jgi:hypothetical protein
MKRKFIPQQGRSVHVNHVSLANTLKKNKRSFWIKGSVFLKKKRKRKILVLLSWFSGTQNGTQQNASEKMHR